MKQMYTCEHCQTVCKTQSSLNQHIKRAKKCLKLRGLATPVLNFLSCTGVGCNHCASTQYNLLRHAKTCDKFKITMLEGKLADALKECEDLKEKVTRLEERPTNIVNIQNNYYQAMVRDDFVAITDYELEECVECLTMEHLREGGRGLARFMAEYCVESDNLLIVDESRKKGLWKNEDDVVITDTRLRNLLQKIMVMAHTVAARIVIAATPEDPELHEIPALNKINALVDWMGDVGQGRFRSGTQYEKKALCTLLTHFVTPYTKENFDSKNPDGIKAVMSAYPV